jgi:hypothetical protein
MPKVITGDGLNQFIQDGSHKVIPAHKAEVNKTSEIKGEISNEPGGTNILREADKEVKEVAVEADGDTMPEETLEQARAKINKKHRALQAEKALRVKMQEERDENERLAESQFNERRMVETENQKLKRELEELKSRGQTPVVEELKPPDKADPKFQDEKGQFDWAKFTDAQAEYRVEKFKADQKAEAQKAYQAELQAKVEERIKAAVNKYPDFMEKVGAQERRDVPPFILDFLRESEVGTDIAYYFADNREELTKISKLSPIMALARLGRLETRFEPKAEEKVEPKVEKADATPVAVSTPPITPISASGAGTVTVDPAKMDFKQLRQFERERRKH